MNTVSAGARPANPDRDFFESTQARKEALSTMARWSNSAGVFPLGNADCALPTDRTGYILGQASSLLSMLEAACTDSQMLLNGGRDSDFNERNGVVLGSALDGIRTLIDLSAFMLAGG